MTTKKCAVLPFIFKISTQRSKEEESQMNLEWDRQRMIETKAGTIMEQRQERLRRQLRKEQDDANKYLNQEQKAQ